MLKRTLNQARTVTLHTSVVHTARVLAAASAAVLLFAPGCTVQARCDTSDNCPSGEVCTENVCTAPGTDLDAGAGITDGGGERDAGQNHGHDGGNGQSDAGHTQSDAGNTQSDAGNTQSDAGNTQSDAGVSQDCRADEIIFVATEDEEHPVRAFQWIGEGVFERVMPASTALEGNTGSSSTRYLRTATFSDTTAYLADQRHIYAVDLATMQQVNVRTGEQVIEAVGTPYYNAMEVRGDHLYGLGADNLVWDLSAPQSVASNIAGPYVKRAVMADIGIDMLVAVGEQGYVTWQANGLATQDGTPYRGERLEWEFAGYMGNRPRGVAHVPGRQLFVFGLEDGLVGARPGTAGPDASTKWAIPNNSEAVTAMIGEENSVVVATRPYASGSDVFRVAFDEAGAPTLVGQARTTNDLSTGTVNHMVRGCTSIFMGMSTGSFGEELRVLDAETFAVQARIELGPTVTKVAVRSKSALGLD